MSFSGVGHMLTTGGYSRFVGCCFGSEGADVNALAFNAKIHTPTVTTTVAALVPGHITVGRNRALASGLVLHVGKSCNGPQVRLSIVEAVAVDVVNLGNTPQWQVENGTVHPHLGTLSFNADVARGVTVGERPAPLVQPLGVGGIYDGVGSNASIAGTEWDEHGILIGHRLAPLGGVTTPADLAIGAGFRRVHYTRSLRVEADPP